MYKDIKINHGVQIIFSTIPSQKEIKFEDDVQKFYFNDYKKEIGSGESDPLYKPLKFYMLGDYDVCYISLINNFKFSHRLFEPKEEKPGVVYNPHTFQSFAGFALNEKSPLEALFSNENQHYFVAVINLKLNNGLLLGNGLDFIEAVCGHIDAILGTVPNLLTQTFSWFELSLTVLLDHPDQLSDILSKLRLSMFKDIEGHVALGQSLYHGLFKEEKEKILHTSLFADTHTSFGLNSRLIEKSVNDIFVKGFIKYSKESKVELTTDVEWQVKPGHIVEVNELLGKTNNLSKYFEMQTKQLVLGKCDYILRHKDYSILSNFYLIRYLHKDTSKILPHIRKVRSYVYLDTTKNVDSHPNAKIAKSRSLSWDDKLDKLAISSGDFHSIDKDLKALKVARQIRIKILKIFSNYNNGIQDPILFPYFLDFTVFKDNLINLIRAERKSLDEKNSKLRDLETKLNEHIKVFQEGYTVRFLNGYQFENISDFDLDFNSSIQQLLTSYGTLVYEYGKLFYDDKTYAPIIQLNNTDTVSNNLCINYSVQHLTSPEFVFATLLKEILNQFDVHNDTLKSLLEGFYDTVAHIKEDVDESYLDDLFDSKLIDLNYFIIDCIRLISTFNGNFQLFFHWFWSYNFQNTSLYDSGGMFNEQHLRMEMLRIFLLKKFYGINQDINCPTPELYTYWHRHEDKIELVAERLVGVIKDKKIDEFINFLLEKYLKKYKEFDVTYAMEVMNQQMIFTRLENINSTIKDSQLKKTSFFSAGPIDLGRIQSMDKLMYATLDKQYEMNQREIAFLKRDWRDGSALPNYQSLHKDHLYAIDQTGGVYFADTEKMTLYFKENAVVLLDMIHFSYLKKKQFILGYF